MTTQDQQNQFQQKLSRLLRRTRLRVGLHGLARVVAVGGPMLWLTIWSLGGEFAAGGRLAVGLVLALWAGWIALLWNQLLAPLLRLRNRARFVKSVEEDADFGNLLVAGEEGLRLPERWAVDEPVRAELRRRLYKSGSNILDFLSPVKVARISHIRFTSLGVVLALVLGGLLLIADPVAMDRGWDLLKDPRPVDTIVTTQGIYPAVDPQFVVAGEDLALSANDFTEGTGPVVCEVRLGLGLWQPLAAEQVPVPRSNLMYPEPYRLWQAVVPAVQEHFTWRFRRGTVVSDARSVTVRHHPLLTTLSGQVTPPAYTKVPTHDYRRVPTWFEVPTGSEVRLNGRVNHPLQSALLVTTAGDSLALTNEGTQVSGTLSIQESHSFSLVLTDSFGLVNQAPLEYEIVAVADEAPLVTLSRPGDDGVIPLDSQLVLNVDAADDYGLDGLELQTRVVIEQNLDEAWHSGEFWDASYPAEAGWTMSKGTITLKNTNLAPEQTALRVNLEMAVDLTGMDIVAGDVLELRVLARDNRLPGPAQISHSRVLRLVLPSAADVLASQAEASEERRSQMEEMRRRGQQLGADLDRLNRELMKNPLPDWARQKEMEAAIERQQAMQQELSRLAQQLQQDLDRLAAGQMTSQKQLEKAEEVSQLLGESASESVQDLLDKMEQAQDQASPQEIADAIREVAKDQKDMARRLDAALAMMKRMEREQDMEGLASLLEQMIRKQQELADMSRQLAEEEGQQEGEEGQNQDGEGQEGDSPEGESPEGENQEGDSQQGDKQDAESQEGDSPEGETSDSESSEGQTQDGEQPPSPEELARQQEALAEELEKLQEKMQEALDSLEQEQADGDESSSAEQMEQALQEALENLEKQMSEGSMQEASEKLSEMDPEQAAQLQQQALRDLGSLYHVLLESQQAMQMAMEQHQISSLRQLAADMLALSTRQEEVSSRIPARMRDVRSLELTRSQHRLQKAASGVRYRLSLLMDESPNRIMKLLGKLDGLIEQMGHVVQALEDNRGPVARRDASASLAEANQIVIGLLTEAQITSQGSSSGSGNPQQSMAQQLQQMAKEQAKLNGTTEQLRQMLANRGMSQEARSQMKRLGEAQAELAGRMAQLEDEERAQGKDGERPIGDLGALGEQMESVSEELDEGLVSEETLIRQERILSRMLDARNSVRRRDYTTRRESHTALRLYGDLEGQAEDQEGLDLEGSFQLRYQALEKAPLEYRDLVRRYFTALDSLRALEFESNAQGRPSGGGDLP